TPTPTPKSKGDYKKRAIKALTKEELQLVWDDFKKNNLGLINTYFGANEDKIVALDSNNSFTIDLDDVEWRGMPNFYLCLNMFGEKWYFRVDDFYVSGLHKINLIKL
ncbi:MAG: hypothetical protein P8I61_03375, partial [Opitutae bacterium]|nr:hypothetical protein [Opitutae bacterium]